MMIQNISSIKDELNDIDACIFCMGVSSVFLKPFFPLFKLSKNVTTTTKLGKAMLNIIFKQPGDNHFKNSRIN